MNIIINTLAPTRRIQLNKFNKNKMSNEVKETIKAADSQLTTAKISIDNEDYRYAKNLQNSLKKIVEREKAETQNENCGKQQQKQNTNQTYKRWKG